jgi:hypothetical protein
VSYLFAAFLATIDPPSPDEARSYLLEGALFDTRPEISIANAPDGTFLRMELRYDRERSPMVLRRMPADEAEAARAEAIDLARSCDLDDVVSSLEQSTLILEWDVERAELDEDAWFALHLWQAWVLSRSDGWLLAPDDGLFDSNLQRRCA